MPDDIVLVFSHSFGK